MIQYHDIEPSRARESAERETAEPSERLETDQPHDQGRRERIVRSEPKRRADSRQRHRQDGRSGSNEGRPTGTKWCPDWRRGRMRKGRERGRRREREVWRKRAEQNGAGNTFTTHQQKMRNRPPTHRTGAQISASSNLALA